MLCEVLHEPGQFTLGLDRWGTLLYGCQRLRVLVRAMTVLIESGLNHKLTDLTDRLPPQQPFHCHTRFVPVSAETTIVSAIPSCLASTRIQTAGHRVPQWWMLRGRSWMS